MTEADKKAGFPTHYLGGDTWAWECPTSLVAPELWQVLELFWLCYTRTPGFSGWALQRTSYPRPGAPTRQDYWTMTMFQAIEVEFNQVQSENAEESRHARDLQVMHNKVIAESHQK